MKFNAELRKVNVVNKVDKDGAPDSSVQVQLETEFSNTVLRDLGGVCNCGAVRVTIERVQMELGEIADTELGD